MPCSPGYVVLDLRTRRVNVGGERSVEFTARESPLAETHLRHPVQVLSRGQLLSHLWGYAFEPGSNVVDVYIRYLRRKFSATASRRPGTWVSAVLRHRGGTR